MRILVNIALWIYFTGIWIASVFHTKARKMVRAQRSLLQRYQEVFPRERRVIWFHVSSLGEFEQGRPLLEAWKKERPNDFIFLTFFSPSGYEVQKDFPLVDYVDYLPFDSSTKLTTIAKIVDPHLFVLVKYDLWPNLLHQLNRRQVPVVLISGKFRSNQIFFRSYGGYLLRQLKAMKMIFVQDPESVNLLQRSGVKNVRLAGDTRIDRVSRLREEVQPYALVAEFVKGSKIVIGGSTWASEEKYLARFRDEHEEMFKSASVKYILAPHDVSDRRIDEIVGLFKKDIIRYSELHQNRDLVAGKKVLLIDKIGILSSLYQYGDIAFIGGGFGRSIHNILEPAAFGLFILFGPRYSKFEEAEFLLKNGGAKSVKNFPEFQDILQQNLINEKELSIGGAASRAYIENSSGATNLITSYLLENT